MQFKFLLKAISFGLLSSFVLANDCDDIKKFIKEKNYNKDDIKNCKVDSKGKVISLEIFNHDIPKKDYDKLFSYNTIKKLNFTLLGSDDIERKESKKAESLPKSITKLTNLEELYLDLYHSTLGHQTGVSDLPLDVLPKFKKLRKLYLTYVSIGDKNLDEIATISSLEDFTLDFIGDDYVDNYENFKNLSKLTTFELKNVYLSKFPDFIFSLKNLKKIVIPYVKEISKEFCKLKTVEYLYLSGYFESVPECLNELPKLKYIKLSSDNVNEQKNFN